MSPMFQTVRITRASEDVVQQIRAAIFSGDLQPGDRLPPERELVREFGVSRMTVREALRILEATGIISVRTGSAGGAFVSDITSKAAADSFATLLKLRKATVDELSEARMAIEIVIAELAARRADISDLAALEQSIEHARQCVADNISYVAASREFHLALAVATKNRVLLSAAETFWGFFVDSLDGETPAAGYSLRSLAQHDGILNAVRRKDVADARRLMEAHMCKFKDEWQRIVEGKTTLS